MADSYRRELDRVGKGGVHCYCCNDYKGKDKAILNRLVRSRLNRESRLAIEAELDAKKSVDGIQF